jgi:hypothetical protein
MQHRNTTHRHDHTHTHTSQTCAANSLSLASVSASSSGHLLTGIVSLRLVRRDGGKLDSAAYTSHHVFTYACTQHVPVSLTASARASSNYYTQRAHTRNVTHIHDHNEHTTCSSPTAHGSTCITLPFANAPLLTCARATPHTTTTRIHSTTPSITTLAATRNLIACPHARQ